MPEFKEAKWEEWDAGRYSADMAFGFNLSIRKRKMGYSWKVSDMLATFDKGTAATLEEAKKQSVRVYHKYITEQLKDCLVIGAKK